MSHSYIQNVILREKLIDSATNWMYRIQITRSVVPNVIFTASCAEWDPIWSKTDILLEVPEKSHVSKSKRAFSHTHYQKYASGK